MGSEPQAHNLNELCRAAVKACKPMKSDLTMTFEKNSNLLYIVSGYMKLGKRQQ